MTPIFYEPQHVALWLGQHEVVKGRPYVDAVYAISWSEKLLEGKVWGSSRFPYEVKIQFYAAAARNIMIEGRCSCPVGFNCKHVAALLLANIKRNPTVVPRASTALSVWFENFRSITAAEKASEDPKKPYRSPHTLIYGLTWVAYQNAHQIEIFKAPINRQGVIGTQFEAWDNLESALTKPPKYVSEEDLGLLRELWLENTRNGYQGFALRGKDGAQLLQKLVASGRLFIDIGEADSRHRRSIILSGPLMPDIGDGRPGQIAWKTQAQDRIRPILQTEPSATMVVATDPPWYVDKESKQAGIVQMHMPMKMVQNYLTMPPISLAEAPLVAKMLKDAAPELPAPPSLDQNNIRVIDLPPTPSLYLDTKPKSQFYGDSNYYSHSSEKDLDFARVGFFYGDIVIEAQSTQTIFTGKDGKVTQLVRDFDGERKLLKDLESTGMRQLSALHYGGYALPSEMMGFPEPDSWQTFVDRKLPILHQQGWRIKMSNDFTYGLIEVDDIDGVVLPSDGKWFDLEMGIAVGDQTIRLEPLLATLFLRDRRWLEGGIDNIKDQELIELTTDKGQRLGIRAARLKPVVKTLIDLFDGYTGKQSLRISSMDLGRLEALNNTARWQFKGDDAVWQLAAKLKESGGVQEVVPPQGLQATLRTYQTQGLAWMQFLRKHQLSGILADDMGLGKTIQTLAHILVEKESGRLDKPALIVLPTTLIHNWREEAQRFAPSLKVLDLNGPQRKERFDHIASHDLILTTYPLLWRDQKVFSAHEYHLLILDEAQYVKNANTKSAAAIRTLQARHRLCLTGTPLENHLGELWSQFDFLLPGFLGSQKDFTKRWRTPIEKQGDTLRRQLLSKRMAPFMLRRRKDEVATELPPKTLIVRTVDIEGGQRDLYETVRAAMQDKVRDAIASKGFARSQIIMLDALLKLRQVCCDPRLVKLKKAEGIQESAKLELLMNMLPEMIEEGRKILLFSQFTEMLDLITDALDMAGIAYVTLTGQTKDRATPIKRFQAGEVPVFLISLKAGGVGMNLTAADTVIHYDPWWNPAAENQATDRAHRLGQDKPVFVYKLIVAGSVEEKIVSLQEKKAGLANSILSEDVENSVKFSDEDLEALFAPLPT